jgi:phosphoribosyl 1,2-cyclic phosphate phosphodiesterase
MTLRITILGCGASTGVPRIDGSWGKCDPTNPKNRRRRASLLIERITGDNRTTVIIDTGPDIREQMLGAGVTNVDGVFYSHDHADHTHGIDDLRLFSYARRGLVSLYFNQATGDLLRQRFDYCFATRPGSSYPPIVRGQVIAPGEDVVISGAGGDIRVTVFRQFHGDIESLGFRIGAMAYSTDLHALPDEAVPVLEGLELWIVDALRHTNHPSHFSVGQAMEWAQRLRPKLTVFSHMTVDLDYAALCRELPDGIIPAYDGLRFELSTEDC